MLLATNDPVTAKSLGTSTTLPLNFTSPNKFNVFPVKFSTASVNNLKPDEIVWLPLNEFEPVLANTELSLPSNKLAFSAYDAVPCNEPVIPFVTINEPVISVLVFTLNPSTGETEAVAEPEAIWDKFNPVIPLAGILYNPAPSPLKDPVNEAVLYELLNVLKLADNADILALLVVILEANEDD